MRRKGKKDMFSSLLVGIWFVFLAICNLSDAKIFRTEKIKNMDEERRKYYRKRTGLYELVFAVICLAMFLTQYLIPGSGEQSWFLAVFGIPVLLVVVYVIYLERKVSRS
jgi:amino acid transporter